MTKNLYYISYNQFGIYTFELEKEIIIIYEIAEYLLVANCIKKNCPRLDSECVIFRLDRQTMYSFSSNNINFDTKSTHTHIYNMRERERESNNCTPEPEIF